MKTSSTTIRRWLAALLVLLIAASVIGWYATRDELPDVIRVATATEGGLYHELGAKLAARLSERTGVAVEVLPTAGSRENRELLEAGAADIAILQSSSARPGLDAAIAPLYLEPLHVVVRRSAGIESTIDLAGRGVAVGLAGSGMRDAAETLLEHYGVPLETTARQVHFTALLEDESLAGAIVTTGMLNPDLMRLLATRKFELVEVEDTDAICLLHPEYTPATIPRGLFGEGPTTPAAPVTTIAATAYLATRRDGGPALVQAALGALYETHMRTEIPVLITKAQARTWSLRPLHPAARRYLDPYAGLGTIANMMESLSAVKELVFALIAAAWLAWSGWRRLEAKEREAALQSQKDHLDTFLDETVRIEKEQMQTTDPARLKAYLQEVTTIKLRALEELSDEDLRGDQAFEIFLIQCSSLMRHIQARLTQAQLTAASGRQPDETSPTPA